MAVAALFPSQRERESGEAGWLGDCLMALVLSFRCPQIMYIYCTRINSGKGGENLKAARIFMIIAFHAAFLLAFLLCADMCPPNPLKAFCHSRSPQLSYSLSLFLSLFPCTFFPRQCNKYFDKQRRIVLPQSCFRIAYFSAYFPYGRRTPSAAAAAAAAGLGVRLAMAFYVHFAHLPMVQ